MLHAAASCGMPSAAPPAAAAASGSFSQVQVTFQDACSSAPRTQPHSRLQYDSPLREEKGGSAQRWFEHAVRPNVRTDVRGRACTAPAAPQSRPAGSRPSRCCTRRRPAPSFDTWRSLPERASSRPWPPLQLRPGTPGSAPVRRSRAARRHGCGTDVGMRTPARETRTPPVFAKYSSISRAPML